MSQFLGTFMLTSESTKISIFHGKRIRRIFLEDEWWFSVIDVIAFLTDSKNPRDYWHKMKAREKNTSEIELSTNCRQLKLIAPDGKLRETDCANTEGMFRIIQSIPSPKPNHLNSGWQKSVKNVSMKLKILNLELKELKAFTRKKAIRKIGLKKDCAAWLFVRN